MRAHCCGRTQEKYFKIVTIGEYAAVRSVQNDNFIITQLVHNMPDASARPYSLRAFIWTVLVCLFVLSGAPAFACCATSPGCTRPWGAEMTRNAFTYHTKGIKPLLPANCKQEPTSCAGTVDVYRWVAKRDATSKPVYGTDPYEFDEAVYRVGRMRLALFLDSAPGRIPLYRNTEAGGPGLSTEPGSARAKVLGYCYAAPRGNGNAKLMAMQQEGMTGLARQSTEASEINALKQAGDKTLCYVNELADDNLPPDRSKAS